MTDNGNRHLTPSERRLAEEYHQILVRYHRHMEEHITLLEENRDVVKRLLASEELRVKDAPLAERAIAGVRRLQEIAEKREADLLDALEQTSPTKVKESAEELAAAVDRRLAIGEQP